MLSYNTIQVGCHNSHDSLKGWAEPSGKYGEGQKERNGQHGCWTRNLGAWVSVSTCY